MLHTQENEKMMKIIKNKETDCLNCGKNVLLIKKKN